MFRIVGLPVEPFAPLFGLDAAALAARSARRVLVTEPNAAPCRIGLADAEPGQTVILVNYTHQPADTPYRSSHAVYVREGAEPVRPEPGTIPETLRRRLLSIRAFDGAHMMVDADVVEGAEAAPLIDRLLDTPGVDYLHIHFARRGCYAARVERV